MPAAVGPGSPTSSFNALDDRCHAGQKLDIRGGTPGPLSRFAVCVVLERESGELSSASVPGLVTNAIEMRPHGAHADEQPFGDVGIGLAVGEQGEDLPFSAVRAESLVRSCSRVSRRR